MAVSASARTRPTENPSPSPHSSTGAPLSQIVQELKTGYFRSALTQLKHVSPAKAGEAEYQYRYAQALSGVGDNRQALKAIKKAIKIAPHHGAYYRTEGEIYGALAQKADIFSAMGLAKQVLHSFRSAVRLDPDDPRSLADLASYYINAPGIVGGNVRKARQIIRKLTKINPVDALRLRAKEAAHQHAYAKAEELLGQAKKLDKTATSANKLAFLYMKRRQYDNAFENFRFITKHYPHHITAWFWVGRTSILSRSHLPTGIAALKHYISAPKRPDAAPSPAFAHLRLGDLYKLSGKNYLACIEYAKAKSAAGDHNGKFRFQLGKSLRRLRSSAPYAKKEIKSIKSFSKAVCAGLSH